MAMASPPPMSKNRPNHPPSYERESSASQSPRRASNERVRHLSAPARLLFSLLIAFHLTAVFLAPMSIPPSSPLVLNAAQNWFMQKYLDALYLNHGYHFFAPDPSDGHLIQYQVLDDRGGVISEGEFPNLQQQWPRLLYHRYFMLADQCEIDAPTEAEAKQWKQALLNAYAQQLLREHDGAAAVRVQRITHYPLMLRDALEGQPLTYPETYRTDMEVIQRRQNLGVPAPNQSGAWNNSPPNVARGWNGGAR